MDSSRSHLDPIESDLNTDTQHPGFPPAEAPSTGQVSPQERKLLITQSPPEVGPSVDLGRKVTCDHLINRINFLNFQDGLIQVHFVHSQNGRVAVVSAAPEPCVDTTLELKWTGNGDMPRLLDSYHPDYILVPRGQKFIKSIPRVLAMDVQGARLALPEISYEISHRRIERQPCRDISVYVLQNSSSFSGTLLDFNACSFRVELSATPPQTFEWIDVSLPVNVIFFAGDQTHYSGECKIIRYSQAGSNRSYVLEPLRHEIQRYRKAEYRSQRQTLNPSPNMISRHPLTHRLLDLKVIDLSGTGFSVEEEEHAAVLLPGLILPEVKLRFANGFFIRCSAQVVFQRRAVSTEKNCRMRCGLALIDIKATDHVKLLGMLHQVKDKNAYVCNDLDPEALWDFLFETGFIYPSKYALIAKKKREIKETYAKLYTRSPDIARHFVYQDNGIILGHMAMIRFWENSWLIHHHAARKSALNKAGLVVLDQIGRFGHDTFRIRGMHMDYLVCYYRPQNRFPSRVFGGVAKYINDPKGCSLDLFAFVKLADSGKVDAALPADWDLNPAAAVDLEDLEPFYEEVSGGLMLKALDLEPSSWQEEELGREFRNYGFKHERHLLSLREKGRLKAILVVNVSDIGLNLSDLTHCIKVMILDPDGLPSEILLAALRLAARTTGQKNIPALIYPQSYVEQNAIPYEKAYNLWVFHMHTQSQAYFKYLSRLMKYV